MEMQQIVIAGENFFLITDTIIDLADYYIQHLILLGIYSDGAFM